VEPTIVRTTPVETEHTLIATLVTAHDEFMTVGRRRQCRSPHTMPTHQLHDSHWWKMRTSSTHVAFGAIRIRGYCPTKIAGIVWSRHRLPNCCSSGLQPECVKSASGA
jgi:hypothetical protein